VSQQSFLAGYGAAQALPGPLFSIGAYLGATIRPSPNPVLYGLLGLIGISTPGMLAMTAVLPFWSAPRTNSYFRSALKGVNASVVDVLLAALYQPLWTNTIHSAKDFWVALLAFALLTLWRVQPGIIVACAAAAFIVKALL
jgi:chromate transporter